MLNELSGEARGAAAPLVERWNAFKAKVSQRADDVVAEGDEGLDFERRVLHRAGLGNRCRLDCCGPGPQGVVQWAAGRGPSAPVILCGLAGSTCDSYPARSAYVAGAVVDDDGRRLTPTLGGGRGSGPLIGSADRTLTTPGAKRDWAKK